MIQHFLNSQTDTPKHQQVAPRKEWKNEEGRGGRLLLTLGVGRFEGSRLSILSRRSTNWPRSLISSSLSFFIALAGMRRLRRS